MDLFDEAKQVYSDRQKEYLDPLNEAQLVCASVNAIIPELELTPKEYYVILICMKLCREFHGMPKRDNLIDAANYLEFMGRVK